jgi:spore maturation protein CgeB
MKVLIVGSTNYYAIERFYLKYLTYRGVTTSIFGAHDIFNRFYQKSIFNKILFRFGWRKIYNDINKSLLSEVESIKPQILFIFKGMEIYKSTLKILKSKGIFLVNYNPDNPFIFSGKGSGNSNITKCIGLYDLHFTYDHSIKERLISEYAIPTYILPFGYDIEEDLYEKSERVKEIIKVAFVGNPDKDRANFITQLTNRGVSVDVFGQNWKFFLNTPNVTIYDTVANEEFWKTLRKYRIQLNIMRPHNMNSHNMRTFEVPAIGGIMLAPITPDHNSFFVEKSEVFFYKDIDEALKKIEYILKLSFEDAQKIRAAARVKCISNRYSYKDRVDFIIRVFKSANIRY